MRASAEDVCSNQTFENVHVKDEDVEEFHTQEVITEGKLLMLEWNDILLLRLRYLWGVKFSLFSFPPDLKKKHIAI